jgi:transketolase
MVDTGPLYGQTSFSGQAHILSPETTAAPDIVLIATGSEVHLALGAQERLAAEGTAARVVSMPCWEIFRGQPAEYQDRVLPPAVRARLAVEAASPFGWREWVGDAGEVIGVESYGASAPAKDILLRYGFTVDNVVARARRMLGG